MIGFRFITQKAGEKGVINMSKTIPFVGGIIGEYLILHLQKLLQKELLEHLVKKLVI